MQYQFKIKFLTNGNSDESTGKQTALTQLVTQLRWCNPLFFAVNTNKQSWWQSRTTSRLWLHPIQPTCSKTRASNNNNQSRQSWDDQEGKKEPYTRKEEAASSRKEEAASSRKEEANSCRNEGLGSYSLMLLYSHDACFCLGIYEAFVKPMVFFCVYHMGKLG